MPCVLWVLPYLGVGVGDLQIGLVVQLQLQLS